MQTEAQLLKCTDSWSRVVADPSLSLKKAPAVGRNAVASPAPSFIIQGWNEIQGDLVSPWQVGKLLMAWEKLQGVQVPEGRFHPQVSSHLTTHNHYTYQSWDLAMRKTGRLDVFCSWWSLCSCQATHHTNSTIVCTPRRRISPEMSWVSLMKVVRCGEPEMRIFTCGTPVRHASLSALGNSQLSPGPKGNAVIDAANNCKPLLRRERRDFSNAR